jgi:uncharacterized protein YceK
VLYVGAMQKMKKIVISLALLFSVAGCSTVLIRVTGANQNKIYPATQLDTEVIADSYNPYGGILCLGPFGGGLTIFDYPFSIVFDTLFFPIDYIRYRDAEAENKKRLRLQQKDTLNSNTSANCFCGSANRSYQSWSSQTTANGGRISPTPSP